MNLGEAIHALRKKRGLNQVELAQKAGLTQAYISQLEAGKGEPKLQALREICRVLETPLAFLFLESLEESDVQPNKKKLLEDLRPILSELME